MSVIFNSLHWKFGIPVEYAQLSVSNILASPYNTQCALLYSCLASPSPCRQGFSSHPSSTAAGCPSWGKQPLPNYLPVSDQSPQTWSCLSGETVCPTSSFSFPSFPEGQQLLPWPPLGEAYFWGNDVPFSCPMARFSNLNTYTVLMRVHKCLLVLLELK